MNCGKIAEIRESAASVAMKRLGDAMLEQNRPTVTEWLTLRNMVELCDALLADAPKASPPLPEYQCGYCGKRFTPGTIVGVAHGMLVCYGSTGAEQCVTLRG